MSDFKFFAGSSNLPLAKKVANSLGVELGKVEIDHFSNAETRVRIVGDIKSKTCFLLQSLSTPTDENWVETLLFLDALKRNGAKKIIGIIPWLGYQKQNKAFRIGEAVSVAVVIKTLETMGMDQMITFDLHNPGILNYFQNKQSFSSSKPVVLSAFPLFINEIKLASKGRALRSYIIVAPDAGSYWAKEINQQLGIGLVEVEKHRDQKSGKVLPNLKLKGDVSGKICFIIDDCIYTGETLIYNAKLLKKSGAKAVSCFATHAILSGNAPKLLQESEIDSLTVTDTIFIPKEKLFPKLKIISIANLLVESTRKML